MTPDGGGFIIDRTFAGASEPPLSVDAEVRRARALVAPVGRDMAAIGEIPPVRPEPVTAAFGVIRT